MLPVFIPTSTSLNFLSAAYSFQTPLNNNVCNLYEVLRFEIMASMWNMNNC